MYSFRVAKIKMKGMNTNYASKIIRTIEDDVVVEDLSEVSDEDVNVCA